MYQKLNVNFSFVMKALGNLITLLRWNKPSGRLILLIPAGWALCDGTNGTPNLKSQFIHLSIFYIHLHLKGMIPVQEIPTSFENKGICLF